MDTCPNCGADLPAKAKACPECGADERTGWSEEAVYSSLELPDDDFDYDEFVRNEFSSGREIKPRGVHWFWWATAVALLAVMLFWFLLRIF